MILLLPFVLQAVAMGIDEAICHRRRELRRWERVGHPLDTLLFLICLLWALFNVPTDTTVTIYAGLSVASCLFITKDEWQHRELSSGFENWLHALLFMLHPLVLLAAGSMWVRDLVIFEPVVGTAAAMSAVFAIYQTVYWNWWRA